jgi:DNA-binding response OmpR family regulator
MISVLIVEDDILIADLLQEELEADGYDVVGVARTVEEAINIAGQHDPDFAVVDIKLAHGGLGTDVAMRLRRAKKVGIIFSTGNDNNTLSTQHGDAVMTKPYRIRDIGLGLKIIAELADFGQTDLTFPHNFRLLSPTLT